MEQTAAARSKNAGGPYPVYGNNHLFQQTDGADSQQCMSIFQGSLSLGASQYQPLSQFDASVSPFCQQFQEDGCHRPIARGQIRDIYRPPSLYKRNISGALRANNNHDTLQAPRTQVANACTSPENLLDLILVAQQKLQQLQAVLELMVRVGGQAQEQQSLGAGVKSILSQLFSATACLRQQPPEHVPGFSQLSEGFDLRFDDAYGNGLSNCVPVRRHDSLNSATKLFGMRDAETRAKCLARDSELQAQAMDPIPINNTGLSSGASSGVDSGLKVLGSDALFGDPSVIIAQRNAGSRITDLDVKANLHYPSNTISTNENQEAEEHDFALLSRDDEEDGEGENLPPGSYELVQMAAAEILAEHTHFCEICGKGFKRDANLRMHMRGHGDEYKTPAALAKPEKTSASPAVIKPRRYSCPFLGCKRNKQHRKFQPLKTTLCVKNHYRRSHCPKLLTCSKCKVKKFSVVADLKTHEKHCGQDKWQCSCGTTFSRKDKLTGHVNLFAGHTPVIASQDLDSLNSHREPSPGLLTTVSVEGLECLGRSGTTSAATSAGELGVNAVFEFSNNNETSTMLTDSSDTIFLSDDITRQRSVLMDEKGFLVDSNDNSQHGGLELFQGCG